METLQNCHNCKYEKLRSDESPCNECFPDRNSRWEAEDTPPVKCESCRYNDGTWFSDACDGCSGFSNFERKTVKNEAPERSWSGEKMAEITKSIHDLVEYAYRSGYDDGLCDGKKEGYRELTEAIRRAVEEAGR